MGIARSRLPMLQGPLDNTPILPMHNGRMLRRNMLDARVTEADLMAKLREANVLRLADVRAVVFETTGDISVLHGDALEDELLAHVRRGGDRDRPADSNEV